MLIHLIPLLALTLRSHADLIPRPIPIPPNPRCRVVSQTFYVSQKNPGTGDGSAQNPFNTIKMAQTAGANNQVCNLVVLLSAGTYHESINVDRNLSLKSISTPTFIVGSIINTSGSTLKLDGIQINSSPAVGIDQSGGRLEMNNSSVLHSNGIGLNLRNGATAILNTVEISVNKDEGIHVEGDGTRMWANHLSTNSNNNAGIEITQNAKAFINDIMMDSNVKIGLLISNAAKVNLQYPAIRNTKLDSTSNWAHNLVVTNNAVLEMFGFNISNAAGVAVALPEGFASLSSGTIENNQIGIYAVNSTHPDYKYYDCIRHDVAFINNASRFGTGTVPVPDPYEVIDDARMNQKGCPRVPVESY